MSFTFYLWAQQSKTGVHSHLQPYMLSLLHLYLYHLYTFNRRMKPWCKRTVKANC